MNFQLIQIAPWFYYFSYNIQVFLVAVVSAVNKFASAKYRNRKSFPQNDLDPGCIYQYCLLRNLNDRHALTSLFHRHIFANDSFLVICKANMHLLYGLHDQFTQRSSEQSSGFVILICSSARSKRRKGNSNVRKKSGGRYD